MSNQKHKILKDFIAKRETDFDKISGFFTENISEDELLTQILKDGSEGDISLGQRVADEVAAFGGSWTFIISFGVILILWIVINSVILLIHPFDPYPFILLNLMLSSIAAFQAPIIMMSQNRQEEKDRQRAQHDYLINLKAEMEIRNLQINMKKLFEIQHKQMQMLEELMKK